MSIIFSLRFFTPSLSVHSLAPDRVINGARKEFTKYGSRLMVRYDGKYGKDGINVTNYLVGNVKIG